MVIRILTLFLIGTSISAEPIKVVDGDSLFIGRQEIRLSGIDAPEYHQECYDSQDKAYPCGKQSAQALRQMIKNGNIRCQKIVKDRYNREVSVCTSQGIDLNKQMVSDGWAVAYTRYTQDYVKAEKEAKRHRRGIWQGRFLKPEYYRILQRETNNPP